MKRIVAAGVMVLVWVVAGQPAEAQERPLRPPTLLQQPKLPPTPHLCPPGYIVNGRFIGKAEYLASVAPPSARARPGDKLTLPIAKPPVITGVAWVFPSQGVEIHGTDFTEFYCPSPNLNCRNTTPHLIVNGAPASSSTYGASAVVAPQIQVSGCYTFVVQRKVPVPQGNSQFTEGPGPQSVPYQEYVFAPTRIRIDAVQPLLVDFDTPLKYQIIGVVQDPSGAYKGIGHAIAGLKVTVAATSGQQLADGTPARAIPADHIQASNDNAIVVQDELVQGDTVHIISVTDPHYGDVQSNVFAATMPRRLVISQVTQSPTGYVITGPNFGSDVNQLRLIENNSVAVPQGNLSLTVVPGINTNTFQLAVRNPTASGSLIVWLSTLTPGIGQRRITVTLPPRQ